MSQLRFDYDTTTTRLRRKTGAFIFACVELEAGARDTSSDRSHIVVESQFIVIIHGITQRSVENKDDAILTKKILHPLKAYNYATQKFPDESLLFRD